MQSNLTLRSFFLGVSIAILLTVPAAQALTYYWDTDGSGTPGFGTASGTWGTSAFWGTDSLGSGATANTTITTADTINFGTGTVGLAAGTVGVNGTVSVNKITFGSLSGAILLSGGTQITMGGTTPTITVNNAQDTISTKIVNTTIGNNSGLTKSGTGELILSATGNSIAGDATSGGNGIGIRLGAGTLTVSGGSLTTATAGKSIGTFSGDAGNFKQTGGTVTVNATGDLVVGWNSASTFTLSGGTTSAANIRHQDAGAGVITISGTNITTVGTVIHSTAGGGIDSLTVNLDAGGTLTTSRMYVSATGTGGSHSLDINLNGGTLKASATGNLIDNPTGTNAANASVNVTVKLNGAIFDSNGFIATILRPLLHDTSLGATLDGGLTKIGTGTLILSGTSTYTGATNVNAGILQAGAAAGGQAFGIGSAVTLANTSGVSLNLNSFSQSIGSLAGGGVTGGNVSLGANATLTTGGNNSSTSYAGVISGTGTSGLRKTGNGVLTLTNTSTNTYTGATNVDVGTLVVNGSISTSSLTTVAVGATLAGSGTVGAATINGILAVGNSPGQMNFTGAVILNGSTVTEIDGNSGAGVTGGHDFVNLTGVGAAGALTYGGTMTLDMGVIFGLGSYSWNLFDMASETGTFSAISLTDQYSGSLVDGDLDGVWDLTSGNNTWQFTESTGVLGLTVIPEPSAALLSAIGLLFLLRRRR